MLLLLPVVVVLADSQGSAGDALTIEVGAKLTRPTCHAFVEGWRASRRWLPQQVLRRKLTESVWDQGKRRPLTGPAVGPREHGCEVGFNDEIGQQRWGERFGGIAYAPSNATALGLMRE